MKRLILIWFMLDYLSSSSLQQEGVTAFPACLSDKLRNNILHKIHAVKHFIANSAP